MVFHHHRPLSAVYSNNYSYGNSLYEPGMNDIEKNYRTTLSRTNLRSDRGDLGLYTFAGSNLHGGAPANEKHQAPKIKGGATTRNLYEPLGSTPYGKGYYDHLRAVSPEPRRRIPKSSTLMDDADLYPTGRTDYHLPSRVTYDTEYKTLPSRLSDYDSDLKRTTRKTTTETTADDLYSYNYVDDYKRYATTSTKTTSRNIDSMDAKITSKLDYSSYLDK